MAGAEMGRVRRAVGAGGGVCNAQLPCFSFVHVCVLVIV